MSHIKKERHIMLDIETLGKESDAVVASIGAVVFDPDDLSIGISKQWNISDLQNQVDMGRKMDVSTITWWMEQSKDAIDKTFNQKEWSYSTIDALGGFFDFCVSEDGNQWSNSDIYIWGNGNMFDNVIMRSLYKTYEFNYPVSFRNDFDLRTIKWLFKDKLPTVESVGTGHNAVDDAMWQAKFLNACLAKGE
jgi:exodeoxyribonuclease VIII